MCCDYFLLSHLSVLSVSLEMMCEEQAPAFRSLQNGTRRHQKELCSTHEMCWKFQSMGEWDGTSFPCYGFADEINKDREVKTWKQEENERKNSWTKFTKYCTNQNMKVLNKSANVKSNTSIIQKMRKCKDTFAMNRLSLKRGSTDAPPPPHTLIRTHTHTYTYHIARRSWKSIFITTKKYFLVHSW